MHQRIIHVSTQILLPLLTIGAQIATAFKHPEFGLLINLIAQPFWLYSSYQAFRHAKQIGILVSTVIYTLVTAAGVLNYWWPLFS